MKKNKMMRLASVLLVAVLMTTSVISGTFAKYVTANDATDTARVAKWGVTITANGDDAFAEKYDNEANASGTKVVSVAAANDALEENVVAPGTFGDLGGITIAGSPEVMVNVSVSGTLTLTGWNVTGDWDNDPETADTTVEYCPIVFTINGATYGTKDTAATNKSNTVTELVTTINGLLTKAGSNVAANSDLSTYSTGISWNWIFETGADAPAKALNNKKDTALGNLVTAPTITFDCEATVEQVD